MDRLEAMSTLVAAVDGGSLSAASRALATPLATVSRRVSDLEAHLGAQLVVRTSRRLALTEVGQIYVACCRRILEQVDEAERSASGEYQAPRGHLTITAPVVFGRLHVEPVVLDFLNAYPDIDVRLSLADHVLNLVDDHVDVAVRVGALPDSRLKALRLGAICWVVCAAPDYLERRGAPQTPAELADHACIAFEGLYSSSAWSFGGEATPAIVPIRPRLAVNTAEAALDAAIAGAGVTRVLSYQVAKALKSGALIPVLQAFSPDPLPVSLVYAPLPQLPLKLRAFLDFAAPRLKAALADAAL